MVFISGIFHIFQTKVDFKITETGENKTSGKKEVLSELWLDF